MFASSLRCRAAADDPADLSAPLVSPGAATNGAEILLANIESVGATKEMSCRQVGQGCIISLVPLEGQRNQRDGMQVN